MSEQKREPTHRLLTCFQLTPPSSSLNASPFQKPSLPKGNKSSSSLAPLQLRQRQVESSARRPEMSRTEQRRVTLRCASLSWTLWRWPSSAAGCGSRGSGTPGEGHSKCCTPRLGRTAAGLGWAASGDSSLYKTRYHSS